METVKRLLFGYLGLVIILSAVLYLIYLVQTGTATNTKLTITLATLLVGLVGHILLNRQLDA